MADNGDNKLKEDTTALVNKAPKRKSIDEQWKTWVCNNFFYFLKISL